MGLVVSLMPQPLFHQKKAPGTHCIERQGDPRAGLDALEETKISIAFTILN
jgi:hypothetical protein